VSLLRFTLKFLGTLLACFGMWQGSTFAEWLANQPQDFAVLGSGFLFSTIFIAFMGILFLLWRAEIRKLKGLKWFEE
jgi:hypothetical protein